MTLTEFTLICRLTKSNYVMHFVLWFFDLDHVSKRYVLTRAYITVGWLSTLALD